MKYFETIIIGGGPSGSSTGISLLKRGQECCIIDKQSFPRDKTCGGLLSQKTLDLLSELDLSVDLSCFYVNKTNRLQVLYKNKKGITFDCKNNFYLTRRKIFDNLLIEEYKKLNGVIFEKEKVIDINFQEKIVVTEKQQLKYKYLVCADGCKSISQKLVKAKDFGITVEADIPAELFKFDNRVISLDFGLKKDGYAWIFPKNEYVTVGYGCPYEKGRNCLDEFNEYLANCGFDKKVPLRMKGATLPYGHNDGKAVAPEANILLVGDAAGMADCLTGEGIYFALKSGVLAATAIAGKEKVLETYQESCRNIFELVNKSYKVGRVFYRYKRFFMLFAKNQEKRLAHFCDNEIAYYNYGYNYNMRKKIFSFLWRR
ncbi:MAG: geranylgeranyl reductase family protein [Candidatus Azobacteroides sp.]|nr:geranylgeranyl reductase family protein [Candidatus Azobacteroides sp.]